MPITWKWMMWLLNSLLRKMPDLVIVSGAILIQACGLYWILRGPAAKASRTVRAGIMAAGAISFALLAFAFLLNFLRVALHVPVWWLGWGRGLILAWAGISALTAIAFALSRMAAKAPAAHNSSRRNFLRAANLALIAAPAAAAGYGVFIERTDLRLREQPITIPGLHPDLDGLRIVQLTDIHLSVFLPERVLETAVQMANDVQAHVALVTGDLISFRGDPVDTCLRHLAKLRSDAGTFGCLGNHEIYAGTEEYTAEQVARLGMRFLRRENAELRFGSGTLNLAGVDYQRFRAPYLKGAEKMTRPGALNVLMSHNPDVFPVAARQGWDLTLGGHTHGGQVGFEILHRNFSIARFFTPYVDGLYTAGPASIFVSRGIGTIGVPARLGAPPEVAVIKLCRS